MKIEVKTIGVVGYGLIGGSFGLALKKYTDNYIIAIDKNPEVLDYVLKNNLADEVSLVNCDVFKKCDVVFIGLYPEDILNFMDKYSHSFKENSIVVDLCGIKQFLVQKYGYKNNSHFKFIGAHPMAGKEKNGITVADADLYKGASFLITPTESTD
ncbi:MAG: prephenate dehydrogenase/arogenate dehydrogenase family protein, partial [Clostridia bacterium]|nr:prephenate dehydrogenase/arogenate dehydrogenase family protein [Clostridia bacterium]